MIQCRDGALYTGITVDVERRLQQHLDGRGAKFFRTRDAQKLVYLECGHDRASASRREYEIKQLRTAQKRQLLVSEWNQLAVARGDKVPG